MKPPFQNALACAAKIHCKACRNIVHGRQFRESVLISFPALEKADFDCPFGHPWIALDPGKKVPQEFQKLLRQIPPDPPVKTDAWRLVKSVAAQLLDLVGSSRPCTCKSKAVFRARMTAKLRYYIERYLPPAERLQEPCKPAFSQVQPSSPPQDRQT